MSPECDPLCDCEECALLWWEGAPSHAYDFWNRPYKVTSNNGNNRSNGNPANNRDPDRSFLIVSLLPKLDKRRAVS